MDATREALKKDRGGAARRQPEPPDSRGARPAKPASSGQDLPAVPGGAER